MGDQEALEFAPLSLASLRSSAWDSIALAAGEFVLSEQSPPTLHGVGRVSRASKGSCPCSARTFSISDVTVHGTSEIYVRTLNVLDTRYRGDTLPDRLRLLAVNLGGAPTSNHGLAVLPESEPLGAGVVAFRAPTSQRARVARGRTAGCEQSRGVPSGDSGDDG